MMHSTIENHALKSAWRSYKKVDSPNHTIQRSKSTLVTRAKSNSKPLKIENNQVVRNPED